MTHYIAISYAPSGEKIERRDFHCRKQTTAQGCIADFQQAPRIVKLIGRTSSWYVDGQWHSGLTTTASRKLDAIGFHPESGR